MSRRLDLWLFDDAPILGGAELFALRLARWAEHEAALEARTRLLCPPGSELALQAQRYGVDVEPVHFPKPPGAAVACVGALLRIRAMLAGAPPTVVAVANTALAQAYLGASALTLRHHPPIVHLLHERETANRRSARWMLARTGALLAVGENHARAYRAALGGASVDTISVFLGPDEFAAAAARRTEGYDRDRPRVGVVGRLIPEKGILELLDELAAQPEAWSTLRIAGPPQNRSYAAQVAARAREADLAGRVELLGYVEDVAGFLSTVDVVIVPSTGSEGQVLVILEALAHGLPCVVREPAVSPEYSGLPVVGYRGAADVGEALAAAMTSHAVAVTALLERFGPEQALAGIERAARRAARELPSASHG